MFDRLMLNQDPGYRNREALKTESGYFFDGYSVWYSGELSELRDAESFSLRFELAPFGCSSQGDGIFSCYDLVNRKGLYLRYLENGQTEAGFFANDQLVSFRSIKAQLVLNRWNGIVLVYRQKEGWCDLYINGILSGRGQTRRFSRIFWPRGEFFLGKYEEQSLEKDCMANHSRDPLPACCFFGLVRSAEVFAEELSLEEACRKSKVDLGEKICYTPERTAYAEDADRPQFHLIPPGRWMNEPHGPMYFNGQYHIFYQANLHAPVWDHICWGHWISEDMVHWRDLPIALSPETGKYDQLGCWSGSALVDYEGIPRIYYTAGDNDRFPNQAVAMAKPEDPVKDPSLSVWKKHPKLIKEQDTGWLGEFRDPFVWKENGEYFMIVGTGDEDNGGGNAALYVSDDGIDWKSCGKLLDYDFSLNTEVGHVWELPVLLPLRDKDGVVQRHMILMCACQIEHDIVETYCFIGKWDAKTRHFTNLTSKCELLDLGHGTFTGPSGLVTPDGRSVIFTIAQGKRNPKEEYHAGWAHNGGIPMSVSWDGGVKVEPIREMMSCRGGQLLSLENCSVEEAEEKLSRFTGNRFYFEAVVRGDGFCVKTESSTKKNDRLQENVREIVCDAEHSRFYALDGSGKDISRYRGKEDDVEMKDEIRLRFFLDHSMIEAYVNEKKSMSLRNYIGSGERRLHVSGKNASVISLKLWEMKSAYEEK